MLKKVLVCMLLLVVAVSIGLFVWVRVAFGQDSVRHALAAQLSKSIGQPVAIGSVDATVYPRVTVSLVDVGIGQPQRIQVKTLKLGTDVRALLSRRIEHGSMNLTGARVELPLPTFAHQSGASSAGDGAGSPAVEIISIDEIVLSDVDIVSGDRTLHGDVEIVPQGRGVAIRKVSLTAGGARFTVTGQISDLSGPAGELAVKAGDLNFDQLMAFVSDFSRGAGVSAASGSTGAAPGPSAAVASSSSSPMNMTVSVEADRASMGTLTLEKLAGRVRVTPEGVAFEPVRFGVFGGTYEGSFALSLGAVSDFRLKARLAGVDVAAATAFAGRSNTITGRLSGQVDLSGRGMDGAAVLKTARGTARVDITDGIVRNLGLIQTVVVATSGRGPATGGSKDEPFSRFGATLRIADGSANTEDVRLDSKDILLSAGGTIRLDGSAVNLRGQVQLSDELSKQAGRDLLRYTQAEGRVTLPATISGAADNLAVRIDVAAVAKRAITNRAQEEAQKVLKKGLGGLFRK